MAVIRLVALRIRRGHRGGWRALVKKKSLVLPRDRVAARACPALRHAIHRRLRGTRCRAQPVHNSKKRKQQQNARQKRTEEEDIAADPAAMSHVLAPYCRGVVSSGPTLDGHQMAVVSRRPPDRLAGVVDDHVEPGVTLDDVRTETLEVRQVPEIEPVDLPKPNPQISVLLLVISLRKTLPPPSAKCFLSFRSPQPAPSSLALALAHLKALAPDVEVRLGRESGRRVHRKPSRADNVGPAAEQLDRAPVPAQPRRRCRNGRRAVCRADRKWTGRWGTVFRAAGRPGGGGGEGAPDLDPAASHDRDLTVQVGDLARARGGKGAVPACKAVLAAVFAVCLGEMEIEMEMEMEKVAPGSACGS